MRFNVTDNSGTNLTKFQVPVYLNTTTFNYSKVNASGADLRFTEDDETTTLDYWIETWNTSGVSKVWVEVNVSASSTDTFFMYYGNGSASSGSNKSATWLWYDDFSTNTSSLYNVIGIDQGPWFNTTAGYVEFREYGTAIGADHSLLYPNVLASITNAVIEARVMISVQWEFQGGWWAIFARHNGSDVCPITYGFDAKPNTTSVERPVLERFTYPPCVNRSQLAGASNTMANLNWYDVYATIGNSCDNSSCNMTYTVINVSTNTTLATLIYNDNSASRILGPGIVAMGCYENTSVRYDYFGVRKIACSEPTVNLGEEEEIATNASRTDYFGGTVGLSNLTNTTVSNGNVSLVAASGNVTAFFDGFEQVGGQPYYNVNWSRQGTDWDEGSGPGLIHEGVSSAHADDQCDETNDWIQTNVSVTSIDLSDANSATMDLWVREDTSFDAGDWFRVRAWNGSAWVVIYEEDTGNWASGGTWRNRWASIPSACLLSDSQFRITIIADNTNEDIYVDEFRIIKQLNVSGSVTSTNVSLGNRSAWNMFYASHTLPANTDINYRVLAASNNSILCTINASQAAAGYNISSCAGNISLIKLYANLSTSNNSVTPLLGTWNVTRK